jgi:hypothetical protein
MGRPRPLRVGTRQPLQSRWSRPDESTNIKGDIVYQCHVHGGHLGCSFTYNALLDRRARHCRAQDVYLACVGTAILNPRPQTSGVHAYVYTLRCRDFEVVRSSIPYRRSTTRLSWRRWSLFFVCCTELSTSNNPQLEDWMNGYYNRSFRWIPAQDYPHVIIDNENCVVYARHILTGCLLRLIYGFWFRRYKNIFFVYITTQQYIQLKIIIFG